LLTCNIDLPQTIAISVFFMQLIKNQGGGLKVQKKIKIGDENI
jgi:hypothetical protein